MFRCPCLAYLSMMEALCETLSILSWRAANACGFCIAWSLTLPENNMPSPAWKKKLNALHHYSSVICLKACCLYCTQSFSETDIHFKGSIKSCSAQYVFIFYSLDNIALSNFLRDPTKQSFPLNHWQQWCVEASWNFYTETLYWLLSEQHPESKNNLQDSLRNAHKNIFSASS